MPLHCPIPWYTLSHARKHYSFWALSQKVLRVIKSYQFNYARMILSPDLPFRDGSKNQIQASALLDPYLLPVRCNSDTVCKQVLINSCHQLSLADDCMYDGRLVSIGFLPLLKPK